MPNKKNTPRPSIKLPILFQNDELLVVDKPAGLAAQGGAQITVSLDSLLAELFTPRPLLVHRLDKDTSGIIVAAKNPQAASRLSKLFAEKTAVTKHYIAVCAGISPLEGAITTPIYKKGVKKSAETRFKRLAVGEFFSILAIELCTGRMHQIRQHLRSCGHPILGDDKYGDFAQNKALRKSYGLKRLLLHAARLAIDAPPPFDLAIRSDLPPYWAEFPPIQPLVSQIRY